MRVGRISGLALVPLWLGAQGVGIGILQPDPAAILHLESSSKGLLLPRLDRNQRDAIPNPPAGLVIFNTQDSVIEYYNGRCWLPVYAESCEDCNFNLSLNPASGTIDHVNTQSVQATVTVTQIAGVPQPIALQIYSTLPPHTSYTFTPPVLNGSGSATLTIEVEPIAPAGSYPIIIQAVCGNVIKNVIYTLTIDQCFQVDIFNSVVDYNLTNANPQIPTAQPICVIVRTHPGVEISSSSTAVPAFTTGSLHPQSVVALIHEGAILGRGGDGASGAPLPNYSLPGNPGGDALHITARTYLYLRNGYIFGGGGGGGSAGIEQTFNVGPVNFSVGITAGGGGGAQLGRGGAPSGNFQIGYFSPGQDGSSGLTATGGQGGILSTTISYTAGPLTVSVTPQGYGGRGGDYGYPGRSGYIQACFGGQVNFGLITIPINIGCLPPGGLMLEPGGAAGYAIRRINGAPLHPYPDGPYLTGFIKGQIGP
ncbi:MAG: hypothetical protein RMK19_02445 [Bacteroidia bacterium]|nr:hypothetical protein [Bacteroidia bacterium]MDW8014856.1 hypothetical protein [Bacteroidia bacterium]